MQCCHNIKQKLCTISTYLIDFSFFAIFKRGRLSCFFNFTFHFIYININLILTKNNKQRIKMKVLNKY